MMDPFHHYQSGPPRLLTSHCKRGSLRYQSADFTHRKTRVASEFSKVGDNWRVRPLVELLSEVSCKNRKIGLIKGERFPTD